MMYINNRKFEWDSEKAKANFLKHDITFEEAAFAFEDPCGYLIFDERHSHLEPREILIATFESIIILVVFTRRPNAAIRIISARTANKKERRIYEEKTR